MAIPILYNLVLAGVLPFTITIKPGYWDVKSYTVAATVANTFLLSALLETAVSLISPVVSSRSPKKIAAAPTSTAAMDGIVNIDAALQRYPLTFEHPDWQPLR